MTKRFLAARSPSGGKPADRRKSGLSLTWLFTGLVFVNLLVSFLLVGSISFVLIRKNLLTPGYHPNPLTFMFMLLSISLLTGTGMSLLIGWIPLKPIRRIIRAVNEIASGSFSVRLQTRGPSAFRELSQSVNRLANLSGNVLLLSKVESHHILTDAVEFDLSEQIRTAVLLLEPKWAKKGMSMDIRLAPCRITGSEELLKQVWINLIDNAIKFSPEGSTIAQV